MLEPPDDFDCWEDICAQASATDYDCEECPKFTEDGKTMCCVTDCKDNAACEKRCAKKRKYEEIQGYDDDKLFNYLQDWILSKDDYVPFLFTIAWDRMQEARERIQVLEETLAKHEICRLRAEKDGERE